MSNFWSKFNAGDAKTLRKEIAAGQKLEAKYGMDTMSRLHSDLEHGIQEGSFEPDRARTLRKFNSYYNAGSLIGEHFARTGKVRFSIMTAIRGACEGAADVFEAASLGAAIRPETMKART